MKCGKLIAGAALQRTIMLDVALVLILLRTSTVIEKYYCVEVGMC